jgi:iron(III) transport system substrate-binding protein
MRSFFRFALAGAALAAVAAIALACGGDDDDPATTPVATTAGGTSQAQQSDVTLTLYNAQHESLVKAMVAGFTQETGIKVELRTGKDFDLANQIVQEGSNSPADAFITENSPAMQVVAAKGLFSPVDAETRAQVPAIFQPTTGDWVGVAARATVLVYNPKMLPAADLPASILDLSKPEWKGKVGAAAGGADFQAIVSAVLALNGPEATETWLKGLKTNGKIYSGNGAVMKAVNDGEIAAGIIYHYYWYKDRAGSGANSGNTELYYFPNKDAGGFVSVSGVGALKSSDHPKEAQMLLAYMSGMAGQTILQKDTALEYTVNPEVAANPALKPLSELSIPAVDITKLNGPEVIALMQKAGLL